MSVVDDLFSVRGQVALVTGGASGLGHAFSSILADAGASVVIADLDPDGLSDAVQALSKDGNTVSGIELDVSDAVAVRAAVDGSSRARGGSTSPSPTRASGAAVRRAWPRARSRRCR